MPNSKDHKQMKETMVVKAPRIAAFIDEMSERVSKVNVKMVVRIESELPIFYIDKGAKEMGHEKSLKIIFSDSRYHSSMLKLFLRDTKMKVRERFLISDMFKDPKSTDTVSYWTLALKFDKASKGESRILLLRDTTGETKQSNPFIIGLMMEPPRTVQVNALEAQNGTVSSNFMDQMQLESEGLYFICVALGIQ
jgi:hypothetical protein